MKLLFLLPSGLVGLSIIPLALTSCGGDSTSDLQTPSPVESTGGTGGEGDDGGIGGAPAAGGTAGTGGDGSGGTAGTGGDGSGGTAGTGGDGAGGSVGGAGGGLGGSGGSASLETIDLGEIEFSQGRSSPIEITMDDKALSMVVVLDGYAGVTYGITRLTNPNGDILAQGDALGNHLNRAIPSEGTGSFMVPNTPDIYQYWVPGTYLFEFYAMKASGFTQVPDNRSTKTTVLVKRGESMTAVPPNGTVDVNVFCTGTMNASAANAAGNPRIQAMLSGWQTIYSEAGIQLGDIRYFDMDPQYKSLESIQGEDNDLGKVCRLTVDAPPGINVILVDDISMGGIFGGLGTILGISGGIPAPVLVNGLERSCLAVATSIPPEVGGDILNLTSAHEAGHYLGLFHSTENQLAALTGLKHDPISDTAEDDANNIMFNNPAEGTQHHLTPMQGIVMRSNPLVY